MSMTRDGLLRMALSAAVIFAAFGAGARGLAQESAAQPQGEILYKPTGAEGMIQGIVSVEGEVPPRPFSSKLESDPFCVSQNRGGLRAEDLVVERGRLANALVYVESAALDARQFEPRPWVPALGSRRCRTVPHVLAMQAGQTLYIQNNDRTPHHPVFQTKVNPLFNKGLASGAAFEILFKHPEPPFVVKCNRHPWERGYVAILPHPFFAVTGRDGSFTIEGLPPGDYEVVVWHETLKGARAQVSVGARETKVSNFIFRFPADVRPAAR